MTHLRKIAGKLIALTQLFINRPVEFIDRVKIMPDTLLMSPFWLKRFGRTVPLYTTSQWDPAKKEILQCLGSDADRLNEEALKEIQTHIIEQMDRMEHGNVPFSFDYNADFRVAQMCYLICRILKPSVVLETGVAYGVTSAFILKAMEMNGKGVLHSIDLPPLTRGAQSYIGAFIPETIKHRWNLHPGSSRRILPRVLNRLKAVDVFVNDSIPTYRNIRYELQTVTPYLADPAVVIVDDAGGNSAFLEWTKQNQCAVNQLIKKPNKRTHFAIAVKH